MSSLPRKYQRALSAMMIAATASAQSDTRSLDDRLSQFPTLNTAILPGIAAASQQMRAATARLSPTNAADAMKCTGTGTDDVKNACIAMSDAIDVLQSNFYGVAYYAVSPVTISSAFAQFLRTIETARVDQQLGSNPGGGAATSLVSKPGLTSLVSFALESGAVTQTIDQNVTTFHANADGLFRFLTNQPVIPGPQSTDKPGGLKNLDLSASFNVSSAGTNTLSGQTIAGAGASGTSGASGASGASGSAGASPVDFTTLLKNHQFASATAQYTIANPRDLRSPAYRNSFKKWYQANQAKLNDEGKKFLVKIDAFIGPVLSRPDPSSPYKDPAGNPLPVYASWKVDTMRAMFAEAQKPSPDFKTVFVDRLDVLVAAMRRVDTNFDTDIQGIFKAYADYFTGVQTLGINMITAPELMVLATYSEPPLQPKLISTKFSAAWSRGSQSASCTATLTAAQTPCSNPATVTFNAGVEIYQAPQLTGNQQNSSRFRDAQAALQFDGPLPMGNGQYTQFSLGAYYQYQRNPGLLMIPPNATVLPNTNIPLPPSGTAILTNTKGSLYVFQAVVSVQIPGSGLKVPIGVSWSNRTDLLKGNEVRGHIGFTFNTEGYASPK